MKLLSIKMWVKTARLERVEGNLFFKTNKFIIYHPDTYLINQNSPWLNKGNGLVFHLSLKNKREKSLA